MCKENLYAKMDKLEAQLCSLGVQDRALKLCPDVGAKPPPKMGVWGPKDPSLGDLLLCLGKVRKVRLVY